MGVRGEGRGSFYKSFLSHPYSLYTAPVEAEVTWRE